MPPRASKRKATAPQNSSSITSADDSPTASDKTKTKKTDRVDSLFDSYANSSLGIIDPEGIEALCSDMNVEHTDVRILMFAWYETESSKAGLFYTGKHKHGLYYLVLVCVWNSLFFVISHILNPEKWPMYWHSFGSTILFMVRYPLFYQDEWRSGMKALKVDSLSKLKKGLPELEKEVNTPENFQDFYSYAFRYCLTEEKQKTVDIESVCELLNLVLGSQFQSKVDLLIEYLKIQSDYKAINLDQWMGFLRFCKEVS
ncbi:hypothetical protein POTOM_057510 [Populus tomentosa]|uniref:Defective in cullin neddylation protein n=1 Tax=Populus tomentosa TaxID=118781 RepID=A0A8X7XZU1_POPTO|nr:hypothetical protein POTOM_057510 [Populus tomentosa]